MDRQEIEAQIDALRTTFGLKEASGTPKEQPAKKSKTAHNSSFGKWH
jgi:hypothetical protein